MIIGIDLGTTNSLCSVWRDGETELVPNALGEILTPSVVGLSDQGEIIVGRAAQERLLTHPEQTVATFKRYMGTERLTALGKHNMRPEELSALVLKALKADAEAYLGEAVTEAVITVPAYFNDTQRKATRAAGELAGLKVERLVNEPTAAALAYGLHERNSEKTFLVFDLGGGTFDVSILELFDGIMEVHASAGDNFLGGEDFVTQMCEAFCQDKQLDWVRLSQANQQALRASCEKAKRVLSNQATATVEVVLQVNKNAEAYQWSISDAEFEQICQPLLERLRSPIERALRDAKLRVRDLDEVVLVGGSTRKAIVRKLVTRLFDRLPLRHINPDEVVARGAAVQAGLKSRDAALQEVVMTDVSPYTLGIETSVEVSPNQYQSGVFSPIIERNSVIPVSREDTFYPLQDNQGRLQLKVFQGEARHTKDNIALGEIDLALPKKPSNELPVRVRFTYDVNGLLEVEATIVPTNETKTLVIEQNPGLLTSEEIRQRLAKLDKLKIHPRDQAKNQALMARAERLYSQRLGGEREFIGRQLDQFVAVLNRQDEHDIKRAGKAFAEFMDNVERGDPVF